MEYKSGVSLCLPDLARVLYKPLRVGGRLERAAVIKIL